MTEVKMGEIKVDENPDEADYMFLQLATTMFGATTYKVHGAAQSMVGPKKSVSLTVNAMTHNALMFGCHFYQDLVPDFDERYDRVAKLIGMVVENSREHVKYHCDLMMEIQNEDAAEGESCSDTTSEQANT